MPGTLTSTLLVIAALVALVVLVVLCWVGLLRCELVVL